MFVEEYLTDLRASRYSRAAWWQYAKRLGARVRRDIWNNPQATRSILSTGLALFTVHVAASLGLSFLLGPRHAVTYLWLSGLSTVAATLVYLGHVSLVRTLSGEPCDRLSPADWITLLRLTMAPGAFYFASLRAWPLALGWVVAGGLTDILDGALARRYHAGTRMGQVFDPLVDIGFNIAMFLGLFAGRLLPGWLVAMVAARYGVLIAGGLFIYIARGPVRIQPTVFGKASGVLIFCLVGARLALAAHGSPELSARASEVLLVALGFLCGAAVIQAGAMGLHNLKLTRRPMEPPTVVADVPFRAAGRRDP